MIEVTVYTNNEGYVGYEANGHAEYADIDYDIICASASMLMINTENSICLLTDDIVESEMEDGYINVRFPEGLSKDGTLLVDSMIIGLKEIQDNYESKYLVITLKEEK